MFELLVACVIVYPTDHPYRVEIRNHEYAHCHGWAHTDGFKTSFKKASQPPKELLRKPLGMPLITIARPTKEVLEICGGHLGCQWFD